MSPLKLAFIVAACLFPMLAVAWLVYAFATYSEQGRNGGHE